jgi:hypothetical protein
MPNKQKANSPANKQNKNTQQKSLANSKEQSRKVQQRKTEKKKNKSSNTVRKTRNNNWWSKTSNTNKILIAVTTCTILAVLLGIWMQNHNFWKEHRARIELNKPIQLVDPAVYDTQMRQFNTKRVRMFYKNISKDTPAKKTFGIVRFSIVPEKKIEGIRTPGMSVPEVTDDTCTHVFSIPGQSFIDASPGEERFIEFAESVKIGRPEIIEKGDTFQVYAVGCVHYSEEDGTEHGTCDRFRLMDGFTDSVSFKTDVPVVGNFVYDLIGHCAN